MAVDVTKVKDALRRVRHAETLAKGALDILKDSGVESSAVELAQRTANAHGRLVKLIAPHADGAAQPAPAPAKAPAAAPKKAAAAKGGKAAAARTARAA